MIRRMKDFQSYQLVSCGCVKFCQVLEASDPLQANPVTSTPAAPPAAVTHSNTRLQELKPPRTFWSVVQPTIDSEHVWDTRWRNMIRRDQRLLGTYRQVAASQNPPALGSGPETLIWFWFCSLIPILASGAAELILISSPTETF